MSRYWSLMVGRTEFTNTTRGLYVRRRPKGQPMKWRVVVARKPPRLKFSERNGYVPKPRTWRVWPIYVTYYAQRTDN